MDENKIKLLIRSEIQDYHLQVSQTLSHLFAQILEKIGAKDPQALALIIQQIDAGMESTPRPYGGDILDKIYAALEGR